MDGIEITLSSPERIQIRNEDGSVLYGADQEWYTSYFRRQAGCGPTVASTLLLYLQGSGRVRLPVEVHDVPSYVALMDAVWRHVTPNLKGVSTLPHFCRGVHGFLRQLGQSLECHTLGIPRRRSRRPTLPDLAAFLAEGLRNDCPIAFLILSSGSVENLEAWHWVTIVSFAYDPTKESLVAEIYNATQSHRVDLKQWLAAPGNGGGFIYFT